ncbi:MAG TPA: HAD-IIIA family hydrolase, partial [Candidatus Kapabacteria bacterium]|nr:HAD-IIIA family hydrolase [Candidatus Kapabacteria bacterium]
FKFIEDFFNLLKKIKESNYLAILISNQQGIGKGLMTLNDLEKIHNYMQNELEKKTNYKLDDIFICTSLASENDYRRKPNPGMILEAIEKYDIDPNLSFMVGDSLSDVEAGKRAGVKTIFIGDDYNIKANFNFVNIMEFLEHFENVQQINPK